MKKEYRNYLLLFAILIFSVQVGYGKSKNEIEWITFDELAEKQEVAPKKVLISVYTKWCGWCKKMDKEIYANEDLATYVNDNFYAIQLDAETKKSINFKGKTYNYVSDYKVNELAAVLLQGQMSYPSTIIMMEDMTQIESFPGYMELPVFESILMFFGSNAIVTESWQNFQRDFKASWRP